MQHGSKLRLKGFATTSHKSALLYIQFMFTAPSKRYTCCYRSASGRADWRHAAQQQGAS